jgi:hypothetical protein
LYSFIFQFISFPIPALPTLGVLLKRPTNFSQIYESLSVRSYTQTVDIPSYLSGDIPAQPAISMILYQDDTLFVQKSSHRNVTSPVLSLDIEGVQSGATLSGFVTFTFPLASGTNASSFTCAYWDVNASTWGTSGCQLVAADTNTTHVVCQCSHLTNFAVLANPSNSADDSELSDGIRKSLEIITYVGLIASIVFMGITAFVYLIYKVLYCLYWFKSPFATLVFCCFVL